MSRHRAFTLVETLVSSALLAVLLVTLMQVIGAISRDRLPSASVASEGEATVRLLRWDLAHAHTAHFGADRLVLSGHGALGRGGAAIRHQPVSVTYELESIAGRTWLVRRQTDAGNASAAWTELISSDVTAFTVEPAAEMEAGPIKLVVTTRTVPAAVRLRIEFRSGQRTDDTIVLR